MKLRAPSPTLALKRPGGPGSVKAKQAVNVLETRSVMKREKDGDETVTWEKSSAQQVASVETASGFSGISGVSLGLTIPGPRGSYKVARIDVSCYLPHGPSDAEAKAAIERASNICSERLGDDADEIVKSLEDPG